MSLWVCVLLYIFLKKRPSFFFSWLFFFLDFSSDGNAEDMQRLKHISGVPGAQWKVKVKRWSFRIFEAGNPSDHNVLQGDISNICFTICLTSFFSMNLLWLFFWGPFSIYAYYELWLWGGCRIVKKHPDTVDGSVIWQDNHLGCKGPNHKKRNIHDQLPLVR